MEGRNVVTDCDAWKEKLIELYHAKSGLFHCHTGWCQLSLLSVWHQPYLGVIPTIKLHLSSKIIFCSQCHRKRRLGWPAASQTFVCYENDKDLFGWRGSIIRRQLPVHVWPGRPLRRFSSVFPRPSSADLWALFLDVPYRLQLDELPCNHITELLEVIKIYPFWWASWDINLL